MNVHFKEHALLACNPFITNCQRALHFYPPPPTPGQTPWSWPKSHQVTMAQTKTTKINMMEPKKMALMEVVRPLSKIYNSGTLINSRPARRSRRTRKTLAFWRQVEALNGAFPPIPQWCESPWQALGCPKCIKHTAPWFLRNKNVSIEIFEANFKSNFTVYKKNTYIAIPTKALKKKWLKKNTSCYG